jgi:hypothetical protein
MEPFKMYCILFLWIESILSSSKLPRRVPFSFGHILLENIGPTEHVRHK